MYADMTFIMLCDLKERPDVDVNTVRSPVNIIEQTLYKLMLDFSEHVQVIISQHTTECW